MVVNPKLRALQGMDDEGALHAQPAQDNVQEAEREQHGVGETERSASEQKIAAIMRDIQSLPDSHPRKAELMGKLQQAQSAAGAGVADATTIASIAMETDAEQAKLNAEEGQKIQQSVGGFLAGLGAIGALLNPEHMAGALQSGREMLSAGISPIVDSFATPALATEVGGPGMRVAMMPAIDKGQGMGLGDRA